MALTKEGFDFSGASGSAAAPNAVGDVYELEVRGELTGGVPTSNKYFYRQDVTFANNVDPADQLVAEWTDAVGGSPMSRYKVFASDQFSIVCFVVRNLTQADGFTRVYSEDAGTGQSLSEIISPNWSQRIVVQNEDGNRDHLKSIYLPGIAASQFNEARLTSSGLAQVNLFIQELYQLTFAGPPAEVQFTWMYGQIEGVWKEARAAYPACFGGRLKARSAAVC